MEDKIICIEKNVNVDCISISLDNIKYYREVTFDDEEYEAGKEKYKTAFIGKFKFELNIKTGKPIYAEGIGNKILQIGSGFFEKRFREQVPVIERECEKGFKSIIKQLNAIQFD